MRIKLTKLKDAPNPLHPNHIEPGFEKIGELWNAKPTVGQAFVIDTGINLWVTSVVQEIIDDNTFRTFNSIYHWEVIDKLESWNTH